MFIVGIGGTLSPASSSERALHSALAAARERGAWTEAFTGERMRGLPMYDPARPDRTPAAVELVEALRAADGVIISSAAYHGSVSGLLKNALDHVEDLARDERPYLTDRPVGLVSVARGWQGAVHNLAGLRTITHALRGWPTPYGCVINTAPGGRPGDPVAHHAADLALVAEQVVAAAGHGSRPRPRRLVRGGHA
ncbi:NADPH-dependent FMN reductase [Pimelobacter sp. 30-1]|uniref:NADPH-dependent FMN reductase n=1 Tax=Pimelobacter sp. 30-1 TaxID=2004991 RepID=UPI001C045811|nr:NADPH-dependent FMN reductase [Pimelobacter sp. 30-1]